MSDSANVELARSIVASWDKGDYSSADWAHPAIELVAADGPAPNSWTGLAGMAEGMRELLRAWKDFRIEPQEYRDLGDERVLVFANYRGRGRTSGLELGGVHACGAGMFEFHDGKVTRYTFWLEEQNALTDLGIARRSGTA